MKIYNLRGSNAHTDEHVKKGYKSPSKRNHGVIPGKVGVPSRRKTSKKRISTKNKKFLEGLGLKVKQSIENC